MSSSSVDRKVSAPVGPARTTLIASQGCRQFSRSVSTEAAQVGPRRAPNFLSLCIVSVWSTCPEGKKVPLADVRRAREQEVEYVFGLRVYEKVDEREALAKYPIDTKCTDTNRAFDGEPTQVR